MTKKRRTRLSEIWKLLERPQSAYQNEVRKAYPALSWRPAAAMRDFLIHDYPSVDAEAVWNTVANDLPVLKKGIKDILKKRGGGAKGK